VLVCSLKIVLTGNYFGTIEEQFVEESNLVYVFLNSGFTNSKNPTKTIYAYDNLPDYYTETFNFNKKKFTNSHFITNKNIEEIVSSDDFKRVDSILDEKWPRYKRDPFWYNTFIRVIVLCVYVKNRNLKNTIHIEADNIITHPDISVVSRVLESGEFGYTVEAPNSSAPSIIFIKDKEAADTLIKLHIKLLEKGEVALQPYVGHFASWITDMAFLDIIGRYKKNYKLLPCLPYGPYSENFDKLQTVFDPTSYGMYFGGTNQGHPEGYTEYRHFIGKEIIENNIKLEFDKTPTVIYNNTSIPIFNLHVHNKKSIKPLLCKLQTTAS
jgi:hypothetical protein